MARRLNGLPVVADVAVVGLLAALIIALDLTVNGGEWTRESLSIRFGIVFATLLLIRAAARLAAR